MTSSFPSISLSVEGKTVFQLILLSVNCIRTVAPSTGCPSRSTTVPVKSVGVWAKIKGSDILDVLDISVGTKTVPLRLSKAG